MKINKDIFSLKPSATLEINEKVKALRKEGQTINHFGFGQSPFPIHDEIVNELKDHATNNHYLPVDGLEELRSQVSEFLSKNQGINAEKEQIFIGPGSKELLYQSILIFEGHFLIPKGSWVSYIPQIKSKGGAYSILETSIEHDFKLTAQGLEEFIQEHDKQEQYILILNSPNNPTGAIYTDEEYKELAEACRKHEIIVLSDEIYSQVNFDKDHACSISSYYPEKTIVFGGLSKVFSAGGYRLGYMVLPKEFASLTKVYRSLFSETFSCVASPVQYAAVKAYKYSEDIQKYVSEASVILSGVSSFIFQQLTAYRITCTNPRGAFYMMIGFDQFQDQINALGIRTSKELAIYLLEEYQVALLPASDFGFQENELFFRLAFVDFDGTKAMMAYREKGTVNIDFLKQECPNMYKGVYQLVKFVNALKTD
ncbi:pyridoxal phosphate-dependent aminotransferase [Pseudotenacibaculum haliotis]|uniref:Aminotransferase n=1 Tax=Pseudotenacibaculum haliotis TaxID=1862138 RepID=A0ABW5LQ84_9FLAO